MRTVRRWLTIIALVASVAFFSDITAAYAVTVNGLNGTVGSIVRASGVGQTVGAALGFGNTGGVNFISVAQAQKVFPYMANNDLMRLMNRNGWFLIPNGMGGTGYYMIGDPSNAAVAVSSGTANVQEAPFWRQANYGVSPSAQLGSDSQLLIDDSTSAAAEGESTSIVSAFLPELVGVALSVPIGLLGGDSVQPSPLTSLLNQCSSDIQGNQGYPDWFSGDFSTSYAGYGSGWGGTVISWGGLGILNLDSSKLIASKWASGSGLICDPAEVFPNLFSAATVASEPWQIRFCIGAQAWDGNGLWWPSTTAAAAGTSWSWASQAQLNWLSTACPAAEMTAVFGSGYTGSIAGASAPAPVINGQTSISGVAILNDGSYCLENISSLPSGRYGGYAVLSYGAYCSFANSTDMTGATGYIQFQAKSVNSGTGSAGEYDFQGCASGGTYYSLGQSSWVTSLATLQTIGTTSTGAGSGYECRPDGSLGIDFGGNVLAPNQTSQGFGTDTVVDVLIHVGGTSYVVPMSGTVNQMAAGNTPTAAAAGPVQNMITSTPSGNSPQSSPATTVPGLPQPAPTVTVPATLPAGSSTTPVWAPVEWLGNSLVSGLSWLGQTITSGLSTGFSAVTGGLSSILSGVVSLPGLIVNGLSGAFLNLFEPSTSPWQGVQSALAVKFPFDVAGQVGTVVGDWTNPISRAATGSNNCGPQLDYRPVMQALPWSFWSTANSAEVINLPTPSSSGCPGIQAPAGLPRTTPENTAADVYGYRLLVKGFLTAGLIMVVLYRLMGSAGPGSTGLETNPVEGMDPAS